MKTRTNNKMMTSLSSNSAANNINVKKLNSNKRLIQVSKRKQLELNTIQEANEQLLNAAPVAIFIHENGIL